MTWRHLTSRETAYIDKLLSTAFPGRDALCEQIRNALVRQIDDGGSLEFKPVVGPVAQVMGRIPVEAETRDLDGIPLHMLLHVIDGRVSELEIYRDAPGPILKLPPAAEWELFVPYTSNESETAE